VPTTALALNAVAASGSALAGHLDGPTRLRLVEWLRAGRPRNPRAVWPTQFVLAADDLATHRRLLDELRGEVHEPAVLVAVALAACSAPTTVLTAMAPELRAVVEAIPRRPGALPTEKQRIRAGLEARLAGSDAGARSWITEQVVSGPSPGVAGTVAKAIVEAHPDGLPPPLTTWTGTLLVTKHADAAERLARALRDASALEVDSLPALTRTVLDRLTAAAEGRDDGGLPRTLLHLLVVIDEARPLGAHATEEVHG